MPRPNRTDRRLHLFLELFKLGWVTTVVVIGGIVTVTADRATVLSLGYLAAVTFVLMTLAMFWTVIHMIQTLTDES